LLHIVVNDEKNAHRGFREMSSQWNSPKVLACRHWYAYV